jgi:hypothetical protein
MQLLKCLDARHPTPDMHVLKSDMHPLAQHRLTDTLRHRSAGSHRREVTSAPCIGWLQGGSLKEDLCLGARVCALREAGSMCVGLTRRGEQVSRLRTRPWTGRAGGWTGGPRAADRMCPRATKSLSPSCAGALGCVAAVLEEALLCAGSSSHKLHMKSPSACHASKHPHTPYNQNGH